MSNPKILNLDDLETPESEISIKHNGASHQMRTLDVEGFIRQQRRAADHQKRAENVTDVKDEDMVEIVVIIRDAIQEFFPTLPVSDLPPAKLFTIFTWLNQITAEINEVAAPTEGEGVVSAEGNVDAETETVPS